MSAPALRVVHDSAMTIDARIDDTDWQRLDEEIRTLVADGNAAARQQDRRGMQLAADLTVLYRDGRWMDEHETVGAGNATKPDSADQFARWATGRYALHRNYVIELMRYARRASQIKDVINLTVGAWKRVEAVTGRATYLSDRDKYIPRIVEAAAQLAREEGRGDVGAEQVTRAAKAIQAELLNNPGIKLHKRTRADVLRSRMVGAAKVLAAIGALRSLGEAINECTEIFEHAKADR